MTLHRRKRYRSRRRARWGGSFLAKRVEFQNAPECRVQRLAALGANAMSLQSAYRRSPSGKSSP